jgi:CubicO group peptidase (beta-lactamase class C family)
VTPVHGDEELAARVRALAGARHPVIAAATLTRDNQSVACLGATLAADFEIGSVSKGLTGLLYADALDRGEIGPSTTLGDVLPLGDAPVARVSLASASTHRSGLPRLPRAAAPVRRTLALWRHGTNPYRENLDELLRQARDVKLSRPRPRYSNLGFELLGHAIARAAGMTYPELVRTRIAETLGLDSLHVPASPDELGVGALRGTNRAGRVQEPWTSEALGPAGGIRASIADMARLTAALLEGSAPGMSALEPVASFSGPAVRIGAAWLILERKDRRITWHNGGTGGFHAWLGMDRDAGTGVVLMTATSRSVDRHGFTLLSDLTGTP